MFTIQLNQMPLYYTNYINKLNIVLTIELSFYF